MRIKGQRELRVVRHHSHDHGVEPLAKLVQEAMDAAGLRVTDVARLTGLSRQYISHVVNRREPYGREPSVQKMQALAKLPGVSIQDVALAVAQSTGRPLPIAPDAAPMTPLRRSVHAVVDKIDEADLPRALQILTALL